MPFGKKIPPECHKLSQGAEAVNLSASLTFFSLSSAGTSPWSSATREQKARRHFDLLKICQCERKSELGLMENILHIIPLLHDNIHYFPLFS